ncbi:nucleotidyltransferase family protein [Aureimonas leprariae]|uniref:Nucleotidyltransferase family protein n=1 Tax=Plantimonas leprariae TaxID=2615207 RepID=A0A7V7PSW1_9HYPH|nr:nucleotidyltransferase family protein [Aureimonas leprariae]KAB0682641.1 nucleotidyltransferase family protein [Aureimonas leprariae]
MSHRQLPSTTLKKNIDAVRAIIARYPVSNPRLFGSLARGEERSDSDIDILVDKGEGLTYFGLGGLSIELEELLGARVDIVLSNTLRDHVRPSVLRDARPL